MKPRKITGIAVLICLCLFIGMGAAFSQSSRYSNYVPADEGLEQQLQTKQKEYFRKAADKCADEEEYSPSENLNDLGSECYDDNMSRAYAVQRDITELENELKQEKCPARCLNRKHQKNCPSYCR